MQWPYLFCQACREICVKIRYFKTKYYFDGGDRLYGETGTGLGPGLFPGP